MSAFKIYPTFTFIAEIELSDEEFKHFIDTEAQWDFVYEEIKKQLLSTNIPYGKINNIQSIEFQNLGGITEKIE